MIRKVHENPVKQNYMYIVHNTNLCYNKDNLQSLITVISLCST